MSNKWGPVQDIKRHLSISGHVTHSRNTLFQLKYAKTDGLKLLRRMYASVRKGNYLTRKRLKIQRMLDIVGEHL